MAAFAALLGTAALQEPPPSTSSKGPTLKDLAEQEADFRGCDRDWNRVNDVWATDISGLYELTTKEKPPEPEKDFRANDRDWCHVNDFWTVNVASLYTIAGTAAPGTDPAIKLIELSVASADEGEESPD